MNIYQQSFLCSLWWRQPVSLQILVLIFPLKGNWTVSQVHCPLTIFPGLPCSKVRPCFSVLTMDCKRISHGKEDMLFHYLCPSCYWEINVRARIMATLSDQVDKDYIKFDSIQNCSIQNCYMSFRLTYLQLLLCVRELSELLFSGSYYLQTNLILNNVILLNL